MKHSNIYFGIALFLICLVSAFDYGYYSKSIEPHATFAQQVYDMNCAYLERNKNVQKVIR